MNEDLVTVIYFWKIKQSKVGFALLRMALDRSALRRFSGVRFAKMLGTGKGETFTPRDADATRWGALVVIESAQLTSLDNSKLVKRWRKNSVDEVRYLVDPISSHGLWAKTNPFDYRKSASDGEVVAITRARIKWAENFRFWKAVPPVTSSLHSSPGLLNTIGIGEAPIGLQGTFSVWESGTALRDFAYKNAPHRVAIENTAKYDWYSEELFARFELINTADFDYVH